MHCFILLERDVMQWLAGVKRCRQNNLFLVIKNPPPPVESELLMEDLETLVLHLGDLCVQTIADTISFQLWKTQIV